MAHSNPRHKGSFHPRNPLQRHTLRGIPRTLAYAVTSTASSAVTSSASELKTKNRVKYRNTVSCLHRQHTPDTHILAGVKAVLT